MRLRRPTASEAVLGLLCLMYLITYVDRVNIATAATEIKRSSILARSSWNEGTRVSCVGPVSEASRTLSTESLWNQKRKACFGSCSRER